MTKTAALSVTVVVLAAGRSSRIGSRGGHKLLAKFEGIPLVRRSSLTARACGSSGVVVVTGHRHTEIEATIADLDLQVVHNENYRLGMASSIAAGVTIAETAQPDGIMILLADMPCLTATDLRSMIMTFVASHGKCIVRAVAEGTPGNPVIFPRALSGQLKELTGDVGARRIVENCGVSVVDVEIGEAALVDVDTPEQMIEAGGMLVE